MYNHLDYVRSICDLSDKRFRIQAGRPLDKSRTRAYIERVRQYLDLLEQEL